VCYQAGKIIIAPGGLGFLRPIFPVPQDGMEIIVLPRLTWNFPSSSLSVLTAGVIDVCHYTWLSDVSSFFEFFFCVHGIGEQS
jgi:hypothetical protein